MGSMDQSPWVFGIAVKETIQQRVEGDPASLRHCSEAATAPAM